MSSRINVLIPDGDSTWALSVLQCLSHIEGYQFFVLSNKKRTASKFSKYTSYYKFYKRGNEVSWLEIINSEIESNSISVVIPIAEIEASFFIRFGSKIHKSAKVIPLPKLENFEIAKDKKLLSDFAKANDIPHPKSYFMSSETDKQELLTQVNFPILIKPLDLKGGDGIRKIDKKPKLKKILDKTETSLFFQDYIKGYDIDCSVLCHNGKILTHTIQKGNLEGRNPYAPQLGFNFLNNTDVLNLVEDVMTKLNWSGVAHLDLRYDEAANDYKLIEINPRFWGSIEASRVAGVNFSDLAIQFALHGKIDKTSYQLISFMRLKGVLKSIRRNPGFILKRTYLMNYTEVKSFLKDPLPTLYKFREWLGRRF